MNTPAIAVILICIGIIICTGIHLLKPAADTKGIVEDANISAPKKRYYYFENLIVPWETAVSACAQLKMALVSIETASEQLLLDAFLQHVTNDNGNLFWTAGTAIGSTQSSDNKCRFAWHVSKNLVTYTNWHEVANICDNQCILIGLFNSTRYKWKSSNCNAAHHFICEHYN